MDDDDVTNEPSSQETSSPPPPAADPNLDTANSESDHRIDPIPDTRLYMPDHDGWEIHIKRDSERVFCYSKHPGEDWFHLLLDGEIYVARDHERYCLRCALRMGVLTDDRLFWQHRVPRKPKPIL